MMSLALLWPQVAWGEMSSPSYQIYSDAIGVNGGDSASSATYSLTDTFGDVAAAGVSGSATYSIRSGYQAAVRGTINLSLSSNSVNLGTLSTTTVSTAATVATVTVDDGGYSLSLTGVSGSMPAAVADGAVTAGVEEYGVAVSGSSALFGGDQAVVDNLAIASTSTPQFGDSTTLTFKAAMSDTSVQGSYSQSMSLTAIASF